MKVAPSYISKSKLIKKIEQRAEERAKRIVVGENIDLIDKSIIESQKDSLARFADRNQCTLRFVQDADNNGKTVMKIYEDKHVLYRQPNILNDCIDYTRMMIPYVESIYKGTAEIPSSHVLTTDKAFTNQLKATVKNVLDTSKSLDKKV